MPHTLMDKADLAPILPEIRALFGTLGLDIAGYDDAALAEAVLAVCPVVDVGWPSDDHVKRVFQRLAAGRCGAAQRSSR